MDWPEAIVMCVFHISIGTTLTVSTYLLLKYLAD